MQVYLKVYEKKKRRREEEKKRRREEEMPNKINITEKLFWGHLADKIDMLADMYQHIHTELQKVSKTDKRGKISADVKENEKENENENEEKVDYSLIFERLNRVITTFKQDMKLSLKDFYSFFRVRVVVNEQIAQSYLKGRIERLHKEYENYKSIQEKMNIPEEIIKKELDKNYYFHLNIEKITYNLIIEYFETNYMLATED